MNAFFCCCGSGFHGIVFVVLAIGDQDNRLVRCLARCKGTHRQVDSCADSRTLCRHHRRVDGWKEHLGRDIIGSDRKLRESISCENDQSDLIIRKAVSQLRQHLLGLGQAIRRDIFCQHRIGYVQTNHDLHSLTLHCLQFGAELRSGHNYDNHRDGSEQQPKLQMLTLGRNLRHQLCQQFGITIFLDCLLFQDDCIHIECNQYGKQEEQV